MVPGEYAQAASGDWQRFVKAKLRRKIGHRPLQKLGRVLPAPGFVLIHVGVETIQHGPHLPGKIAVLQADAQFVIRDFVQHGDGVVIKVLPAARGKLLKELLRFLAPGPPKVARHLIEPGGQFRDFAGGKRRLVHISKTNHLLSPTTRRKR